MNNSIRLMKNDVITLAKIKYSNFWYFKVNKIDTTVSKRNWNDLKKINNRDLFSTIAQHEKVIPGTKEKDNKNTNKFNWLMIFNSENILKESIFSIFM